MGTSSVGTVTLDTAAPAGGAVVALASSGPAAVTDPSVVVPQGATSARFVVDTTAVTTATPVTIQATYKGVTFSAALTVLPRAPVRGTAGDSWADVVIGQPDFSQITIHEVTSARLYSPGGVTVDRSVRPNRIYVYDGGNSRILGLSHLGTCQSLPTQNCTASSDCGTHGPCSIQEGIGADLVLGQPSFTSSACNGDSGFQRYPTRAPAGPSTLCSTAEGQINLEERAGWANLAVDGAGNLYAPDIDNNRVLRYDSPFTSGTVADHVWGQADFLGNTCNRGQTTPDAQSLCLRSIVNQGFTAGVDIDSSGNLFVTDNANHRVLRFPKDPATGLPKPVADLVLGQPDFTSSTPGIGMNQMCAPAAVRVDGTGTVYVADSQLFCELGSNGRVLTFTPPLTNGMAGGNLGSGLFHPTGLTVDPAGGIWVTDTDNSQFLRFDGGSVQKVLGRACPDYTGSCVGSASTDGPLFCYDDGRCVDSSLVCQANGSIGIDNDGNVLLMSGRLEDVWRFPAPIPSVSTTCPSPPAQPVAHSADHRIFLPKQYGLPNHVGAVGFRQPPGLAVATDQLIVADNGRLLFWDGLSQLTNGKPASGYAGPGPFTSFDLEGPTLNGRIAADRASQGAHLWVVDQPDGGSEARIEIYSLPLTGGAIPGQSLSSPLNVKGGGTLAWDSALLIGGIAPTPDGSQIWVADAVHNRVFRISNPLASPLVDVVLGQVSLDGTSCNQGNALPSQSSLCMPGAVTLDPSGNVYVSDGSLEVAGNLRLLEYDASLFADVPSGALFGVPASRVFGRHGSFTETTCLHSNLYNKNLSCAPTEAAFAPDGQMVVGTLGDLSFSSVYKKPLLTDQVDDYLEDFRSYGGYSAVFDSNGDLYTLDLDRANVLVYRHPLCSPSPVATVGGGGTSCEPFSVAIQAVLTGTPPWNVTWSDGVTQSGVSSSPATRTVSPTVTTLYSVTDVSGASCSGTSFGSALVTVSHNPGVDGDGDGLTPCQGDCDDTNAAIHPGGTEVCNGKDDNCDGSIDNGIPAPSGVPALTEGKAGAVAQLSWTAVSGATGYDVVKGSLATLRSSGGNFTTSTTGCLGNDLVATTVQDTEVPAGGAGSWHVARAVSSCGGNGSYDDGATSQQGSRDAEIAASGVACP